MEGGYCLSLRDQAGDDHHQFGAEFVEMFVCGVVLCGFCGGFGWDSSYVGQKGCD